MRVILSLSQNEPVVFMGDFNCVRSANERWGCVYRSIDTIDFNDFISDCNLLDISPKNANYTWFGPEGKKCKLDRVLVNAD